MALVARTRNGDRDLPGSGTLLARCLAAGLAVGSSCSGRGACGRCLVSILEGRGHLPPPDDRESAALARLGGRVEDRLACCAHVAGPGPVILTTGYW